MSLASETWNKPRRCVACGAAWPFGTTHTCDGMEPLFATEGDAKCNHTVEIRNSLRHADFCPAANQAEPMKSPGHAGTGGSPPGGV